MSAETLQWLNIVLTSGVLIVLGKGLVAYGRLIEKVNAHEEAIGRLEEHLYSRGMRDHR